MRWLRKRSIAFSIILLLVLILIPINILFFVSATLSLRTYQEEVMQSNAGILNVYAARIEAQMDRADTFFADQVITDNDLLLDKTSTQKEVACMEIYYLMRTQAAEYEFPTEMYVYDAADTRTYMYYEEVLSSEEYETVKSALREHYETDSLYGWQIAEWGGERYLIRCYLANDLCFGLLMPLDDIEAQILENFPYTDVTVCVMNSSSQVRTDSDRLLAISDEFTSAFVVTMDVAKTEINRALPQMQRTLFIISILTFAIIPLLYLAIRIVVIRPLTDLNDALHRIEGGDLDYRIIRDGYAKEFIHIYKSFNHMMDEILQLRNEKYEYELDRQRHEMISLQMQIKPHFLYNAFNDVSNMALVGDYGGIRELMGYLAKYFRYTIRTGYELVPLQRELDFLEVYYAIMEMRHPGCFEYEIEVDPRAQDIQVLPLLIHTFVENTMSHSVKEGCYIVSRIVIRPEGERIRIYVTDDGEGIAPEILHQIEQKKKTTDAFGKEHIGIWNCYKRLQIYYHGDADITITSAEMQGVKVVIDMPRETVSREEGNEEVRIEAADRG